MASSKINGDGFIEGGPRLIRSEYPQIGDFIGHYQEVLHTRPSNDRVHTFVRKFLRAYQIDFPRENPRFIFEYACQYADFAFALDLRFSLQNHPYWDCRPVGYRMMQLDRVCILSECKKIIDWVLEQSQGRFDNIPVDIQRNGFNARTMLRYHMLITGGIRTSSPPTLETWIRWDKAIRDYLQTDDMRSV